MSATELQDFEADPMDEGQVFVVRLIGWLDRMRIAEFGGQPSECAFLCDLVVWATVLDGTNRPLLTIERVSDFIENWRGTVIAYCEDNEAITYGETDEWMRLEAEAKLEAEGKLRAQIVEASCR